MPNRVGYIYSKDYSKLCDKLPSNINRSSLVHGLIHSYGLFDNMKVIKPIEATREQLLMFHDECFIDFLLNFDNNEDAKEEYGLIDDCPIFPEMKDYVLNVAGATILAAQELSSKNVDICLHWDGGIFLYNLEDDIIAILGIIEMRKNFKHILYIDLDLHHGDGVEEAFYYSDNIITVSFHRYDIGFFPGTGSLFDNGIGNGENYCFNIPLKSGLNDSNLSRLFSTVLDLIKAHYVIDCIVVTCGADGLAHDPNREWNLTEKGIGNCIEYLKKWQLPLLILGAGGYHHPDTARCWCFITSLLVEKDLPSDIPDHTYFDSYSPFFQLEIEQTQRVDQNTPEYIQNIIDHIRDVCEKKSRKN